MPTDRPALAAHSGPVETCRVKRIQHGGAGHIMEGYTDMGKVRLTVTFAKCRCGYHHTGDEYLVGDLCPPLCHELWHGIYPAVYTLLNGGLLDCGDRRMPCFDARCPDGGRVQVHGEAVAEPDLSDQDAAAASVRKPE